MATRAIRAAAACAFCAAVIGAQSAALAQPSMPSLDQPAASRFPQPVRVGDLIDRRVLLPVEARSVLGRVLQVVRLTDGGVAILMRYGGFLGWGGRVIALPLDQVALLGSELEVIDLTPTQLDGFSPFRSEGAFALPLNEKIHMGLARAAH